MARNRGHALRVFWPGLDMEVVVVKRFTKFGIYRVSVASVRQFPISSIVCRDSGRQGCRDALADTTMPKTNGEAIGCIPHFGRENHLPNTFVVPGYAMSHCRRNGKRR